MNSQNSNFPIGVFDSGVGGLTVANAIRKLLPNESIVYVGDTARVPYGAKTPEELLEFGREIINFLITKNVKAVVLACGTSSANTFDTLQKEFPSLPLIDVLRPGAAVCLNLLETNPKLRLGIIATTATIKSGLFQKLILEKSPTATLHSVPCPMFASMVEAGFSNSKLIDFVANNYLAHLKGQIDALVLGCTHYPLLINILQNILGDIKFINLGESTALKTKESLIANNILNNNFSKPIHEYYISGSVANFKTTVANIFKEEIEPLKKRF